MLSMAIDHRTSNAVADFPWREFTDVNAHLKYTEVDALLKLAVLSNLCSRIFQKENWRILG